MLSDNLFFIVNENIADHIADFQIGWNAENDIYKGHFPDNPITPGVCLVQIVCELFSRLQNHKYIVLQAKSIKFTNVINPIDAPLVDFYIEWTDIENVIPVKAIITNPTKQFAKMSLILGKSEL